MASDNSSQIVLNTVSYDETVVRRELENFQQVYALAHNVSEKVDTFLLCLGIMGNLAALTTMMKSRSMRTPSFVYHKILVAADFIFCINYIMVKFVDQTQTVVVGAKGRQFYYSPVAAFYTAILNRAVTSSCGYVALYMSLSIGIDRFVALWLISMYDRFNRKPLAWTLVASALGLGVIVHSWSTWFERRVQDVNIPFEPNGTVHKLFYSVASKNADLQDWITVKDIYNLSVRVAYPIVLTLLSVLVIWGFNVQQRKKRSMVTTGVNKRQLRRERCLFYLMIAVVTLACVQVIPREAKRLLDLVCPAELALNSMSDTNRTLSERLNYFYVLAYGHELSKVILNTLTAMDRSLVFYLYFTLNHSFRKEVIRVFRLKRLLYMRKKSMTMLHNATSRHMSTGSARSRKSDTMSPGRSRSLRKLISKRRRESSPDASEFFV